MVSCPCCHEETSKIHDYRTQVIEDCEAFGRPVELVLRKRRYVCSACGKRFAEPNAFVPKYHRMTSRLVDQVIEKLSDERSFTSVARETGLSVTTVIRIFDHTQYPSMSVCPEAFAIDEFKGNTGGEKYNVILCDVKNLCVLDILPNRHENYSIDHFRKTDRSAVSESELVPFKKCAQTYSRWLAGILNSFDSPFTNGFTEGCNNKIKVLKRNVYGYRRFDRFRNRILHMFSHQTVA